MLLGVSATLLDTASGNGAAAVGFVFRTLLDNLIGNAMLYLN